HVVERIRVERSRIRARFEEVRSDETPAHLAGEILVLDLARYAVHKALRHHVLDMGTLATLGHRVRRLHHLAQVRRDRLDLHRLRETPDGADQRGVTGGPHLLEQPQRDEHADALRLRELHRWEPGALTDAIPVL